MICFPLDNTPYEAKDMGTYLATRTRGVFSAESNLTVTPGENGLSVSVSPGLAWLKWSDYWGTAALQEQALTLALDTADGALKRIDAIVCRLDKVNNRAEIVVKKGAPSSAPIVVPPVRDANYDELYIATVLIGAGVISISASAITDQRLNEEYCGLMRDGVTGIPTASLHAQAQQILTELTDALNAQIVRQSSEFDAWFEELKGKLGEDPATALQLQVDNLNAAVVGDAFQASGTPASIAYAGANRIDALTLYGETPQGGTVEAPVALTGISSITVNDDVTELPIPRPLRRVGDVKDKCVTRQGHEGVEKLVVTYNVGFVELDGTEVWARYARISTVGGNFYEMPIPKKPKASNVQVTGTLSSHLTCDNAYTKKVDCVWAFVNTQGAVSTLRIGFSDDSIDTAEKVNAYLAAQKAAGTPVQVAYQLAAPEVYATDPVDFDNTAGPLTVMTGGEVEVRMTELVGSRSPELTHKLDKTGDGSNVTAAFTEAEQDADIQTGEELTVLFGKIKKRFSVVNKLVNGAVYPNLLDNSDFTNLVNQRGEAVYDYLTGIGYGPDRWQLVEAKYTLASQTVTSAGSSHTYGSQLRQIIPLEKIKIGDTVTASISTESGILNGTAKLELKIDTSVSDLPYVIEQDWGGVKIGCIKENVCHVIVFLKENKSVKINWVKLEKGGVATPYVPKGYGAELAECLRYFQRVHADWRIYPTLKDMLYRFSQSTLQVMRIKPTISAHGTPYTFGCTINALDAQPMAFTVETKITEQGQNAAAASMLGYFDLSADL